MKRKRNTPQRRRRRINLEQLERRDMLAVDGININLGGSGTIDLFNGTGGGSVQQGFQNQGLGITINTSNVPGQNNENPLAVTDAFATGEDSGATDLTALLLRNDSDPDASGTLAIGGVGIGGTRGNVVYDPHKSHGELRSERRV